MIQIFFVFSDWALLLLRVALGAILITHGWPKISNIKKTSKSFKDMGFVPSSFWASVTALVEFVGGILIILGLGTQLVSLLVFIEFLVILITVKKDAVFKGEVEFDLLILASAFMLTTIGGGNYSLDQIFQLLLY